MIQNVRAEYADKDDYEQFECDVPPTCPHCETSVRPTVLSSTLTGKPHNYKLYLNLLCSNCDSCFIAEYGTQIGGYGYSNDAYLSNVFPREVIKPAKFSKFIEDLSPNFLKISYQAYVAERYGLDEICGIGYRKALEFLVKDYAIRIHPDEEESIKLLQLSPCIKKYIADERLKILATASAWIGNDETHYVRTHKDYDLKDLKAFINAIISYIDAELTYQDASKLLSRGKK